MSIHERRGRNFISSNTLFEVSNRFIPSSSSSSVYRNNDNSVVQSQVHSINNDTELSLREDMLFIRSNNSSDWQNDSSINSTTSSPSRLSPLNKLPTNSHQDKIADALGYSNQSKVFNFHSPTKNKELKRNNSNSSSNSLEIAGPLLSNTSSKDIMMLLAAEPSESSKGGNSPIPRPAKLLIANSILQAPGLRNDFYSNLVSWSKKTNKIAVGLGIHTYLWGIDNDVEAIIYNDYDVITAVSCSYDDYFLIATAHGNILLINHLDNQVKSSFFNKDRCVYCFEWFPNSKFFLAGDEFGEVLIFEIVNDNIGISLSLISSFKCHQQQICGIALNNDCTQVAIGGNDNCCSIWDIANLESPTLKFILPHSAAVKAISFCPWTKSLLATGGGSRDRNIRFWHTNSGTLLSSFNTNGQITSLIWSKFKKELVATFGFGDSKKPLLIRVYSYPQMIPIVEVPATPNLRILSSTLSPDCGSICVATNDSTIRIYRLWDKTHDIISSPESQGIGIYGSSLIELHEGIDKRGDTIR